MHEHPGDLYDATLSLDNGEQRVLRAPRRGVGLGADIVGQGRVDLPGDAGCRSGRHGRCEQRRRDRILLSAVSLFAGGRIRVTGVDSLIARADVAKATFYRHFPSKDDVVAGWLRTPEARWLDVVVGELEGSPPLVRLVDFWGAMGRWAEADGFRGCPFVNTLGEIRDPHHPAYPLVSSYIGEVEVYLSAAAREAEIHDAPSMGRQLRFLAMGMWMAIVFEASTGPAETARTMAVGLIAARLGTDADDVERRVAAA